MGCIPRPSDLAGPEKIQYCFASFAYAEVIEDIALLI